MILQVINYNLTDRDVRTIFDVEAHNTVHVVWGHEVPENGLISDVDSDVIKIYN